MQVLFESLGGFADAASLWTHPRRSAHIGEARGAALKLSTELCREGAPGIEGRTFCASEDQSDCGSVRPALDKARCNRLPAMGSGTLRAMEISESSMCRARSSIFFSRNDNGFSA